jgi:hypothetical protein
VTKVDSGDTLADGENEHEGGAMGFIFKVQMLHRTRIICAVLGLGLFVGMFFFEAERAILAIFSLLFMTAGIVSQIVMAYLLHNATAADRKLGKAAGLYRYI